MIGAAPLPSTTALLGFATLSTVVALSPGPSWIYVITRTARHGKAGAWRAIAGNATGILVHLLAVITGIAALLRVSQTAFRALALAGAAYLVWLGLRTIFDRAPFLPVESGAIPEPAGGREPVYRGGVLMAVLNPKISLLMLAILPQYAEVSSSPEGSGGAAALALTVLGLVHVTIASGVLTLVATSVLWGSRRLRLAQPVRAALRWISGALLIAFGGRLAVSR